MQSSADNLRKLPATIERRPICEDVSLVIPTLGREIIETCLSYIAAGTCWPQALIVVDQGRMPRVADWLKHLDQSGLRTDYVPSRQRGRSAGLNRALERVMTRFVAITDDDCFVRADWLECLAERLRREPGTIWTGRVEAAGDQHPISTVLSRMPARYTRATLRGQPFAGGNAGLAMDVIARVGPFDEHPSLASAEDGDFGYRALRLGIPIAYEPDIVLDHYHWREAGERAARYADYARSQGGFYGKHLRGGDPMIVAQLVRALVRSPVRWVRGLLRGDREMTRNGRESTLNLWPGVIAGFRRRGGPPKPQGTGSDSGGRQAS